jgi:threonine synthase
LLTLNEGGTALELAPRLAGWAGIDKLWIKREDQNPTGSHKDRGARAQMEGCVARGEKFAVISSSGNAALAAARYGEAAGVAVVALMSPHTEPARVAQVATAGARVIVTTKPINYTVRLSRVCGWPDLRPSQSAEAVAGFQTLGQELAHDLEDGVSLFGYASSGTTYQAVGEVFAAARRRIPLHPVQAGLVNGLSRAFDRPGDGTRSIVGDLGVKLSSRADAVLALVRASGGEAWWVDDQQIREAGARLRDNGYQVAPECWAALAGLSLAAGATGLTRACLLLTGAAVPDEAPTDHGSGPGSLAAPATDFAQVLELVSDLR